MTVLKQIPELYVLTLKINFKVFKIVGNNSPTSNAKYYFDRLDFLFISTKITLVCHE